MLFCSLSYVIMKDLQSLRGSMPFRNPTFTRAVSSTLFANSRYSKKR